MNLSEILGKKGSNMPKKTVIYKSWDWVPWAKFPTFTENLFCPPNHLQRLRPLQRLRRRHSLQDLLLHLGDQHHHDDHNHDHDHQTHDHDYTNQNYQEQ